jgi:hypothetical protein
MSSVLDMTDAVGLIDATATETPVVPRIYKTRVKELSPPESHGQISEIAKSPK